MIPVFRSLEEARKQQATTLAIGFFDGLHRGHREVILGDLPPDGARSVLVFTFDPHPARILRPDRAPPLLTGLPHKTTLLNQWKVGGVLAFPFNLDRSRQEAPAFLDELFTFLPSIREVRVGTRWRFGRDRTGDTALLAHACQLRGIHCRVSPDVTAAGEAISSSRIRQAVQSGHLAAASDWLGRPYQIFGRVIQGRKLGRSLGFPTANLRTEDECFPPLGVYAAWTLTPDGHRHPSVINLGSRPTVGDLTDVYLETHLLDGEHDLYGADLFIEPTAFLRPISTFDGLPALTQAIRNDAARAQELLANPTP
ncbi:MAG: riboflavin biosynthesis protein RibF [Verrucomicrobiia bacterium]